MARETLSSASRRSLVALAFVPLVGAAITACGDDSATGGSGAGGAGQAGQGGVSTGGTAQGAGTPGGGGPGGGLAGGRNGDGGSRDDGGSGGDGGNGGNGGSTVDGGGGQGGGNGCTEITASAFAVLVSDGTAAVYAATPAPDAGAAEADALFVEFYGSDFDPAFNGEATGVFDLSMGGDANFATCSRCVRLGEDPSVPGKLFFQASGSLEVDAGSDQLNGVVDAVLTDVTLIEVTIDPTTFVSSPVPGGECLHLASAPVQIASTLTIAGVCQDSCDYIFACSGGNIGACISSCTAEVDDCSQLELGEIDACLQMFGADCADQNAYTNCVITVGCVNNA